MFPYNEVFFDDFFDDDGFSDDDDFSDDNSSDGRISDDAFSDGDVPSMTLLLDYRKSRRPMRRSTSLTQLSTSWKQQFSS